MGRDELLKLLPIPGLSGQLRQVESRMKQVIKNSEFEPAILSLFDRGAKRLRPVMLLAAANIANKQIDKNVISAAAAIELIHEASLVHDDIIDQDNPQSPAQALLIGDYLIAAGLAEVAVTSNHSVTILSGAIRQMAEGQAQQMSPDYTNQPSDNFYIKTAQNKAGSLFAAAGQLGSLGSPFSKALARYGQSFGVAFQIIDDIVDQDFAAKDVPIARKQAAKYIQLAQKAIVNLPDCPAKDGLIEIARVYPKITLA